MTPRMARGFRSSGAVVYDPNAHREFVTGFRRRKQERRAQATRDIAAAEKQTRRDERKQRRAVLRRTADRARGLEAESSDDDDDDDVNMAGAPRGSGVLARGGTGRGVRHAKPAGVSRVYDGAHDARVTTTVTPMQTFADAHFLSRLPKARPVKPDARAEPQGKGPSARPGNEADTGVSLIQVARKRTRSAAKKLSKMVRSTAVSSGRLSSVRSRNLTQLPSAHAVVGSSTITRGSKRSDGRGGKVRVTSRAGRSRRTSNCGGTCGVDAAWGVDLLLGRLILGQGRGSNGQTRSSAPHPSRPHTTLRVKPRCLFFARCQRHITKCDTWGMPGGHSTRRARSCGGRPPPSRPSSPGRALM
jgi:hypothetical protein